MSELDDQIAGIGQLGNVVHAMTGIASARARTANGQLSAVDSYAATLRAAWQQVQIPQHKSPPNRATVILFCAEQGFVGDFSQKVMNVLQGPNTVDLFLIGTRGIGIAKAQGMTPTWSTALPARSANLPKFADDVLARIFENGPLSDLEVIYPSWDKGHIQVQRRILSPLKGGQSSQRRDAVTNLPAARLALSLGFDLIQAELTRAALHAFAAENQARMTAMAQASRQIDDELARLQALARSARQEAITAEIIEIASGARVSRR